MQWKGESQDLPFYQSMSHEIAPAISPKVYQCMVFDKQIWKSMKKAQFCNNFVFQFLRLALWLSVRRIWDICSFIKILRFVLLRLVSYFLQYGNLCQNQGHFKEKKEHRYNVKRVTKLIASDLVDVICYFPPNGRTEEIIFWVFCFLKIIYSKFEVFAFDTMRAK